jgi:hypothetical protein
LNPSKTYRPLLLSIAALLTSLLATSDAQVKPRSARVDDHVIVTPRRVPIIRSGPMLKNFPEKRSATVVYPVISGLKDPRVLRRIQSTLDVKNAFDSSIADYRREYWLEEFSYEVNYNNNYILDITFSQTGTGAYPDIHTKHFAIDLKAGNTIKAADVFITSKQQELVVLVDQKLQAELKEIVDELVASKSDPQDVRIAKEAQEPQRFTSENLNDFSVGPKGITFLYDAGYPHAIQAFEPIGRYFFSYSELKPYIKLDGPLGQFVK